MATSDQKCGVNVNIFFFFFVCILFDIVCARILDLVFVTRILEMFFLCNRLCIFSHSNERYFWKIIYYFQHNLFTKAQHKTFKASTAKQNMKIFFMYNPIFFKSGHMYQSKVFFASSFMEKF